MISRRNFSSPQSVSASFQLRSIISNPVRATGYCCEGMCPVTPPCAWISCIHVSKNRGPVAASCAAWMDHNLIVWFRYFLLGLFWFFFHVCLHEEIRIFRPEVCGPQMGKKFGDFAQVWCIIMKDEWYPLWSLSWSHPVRFQVGCRWRSLHQQVVKIPHEIRLTCSLFVCCLCYLFFCRWPFNLSCIFNLHVIYLRSLYIYNIIYIILCIYI